MKTPSVGRQKEKNNLGKRRKKRNVKKLCNKKVEGKQYKILKKFKKKKKKN